MNEKMEAMISKRYDLVHQLLDQKKINEILIAQWIKHSEEERYFAGLAEGYIDANKKLKQLIWQYGIKRRC
ncbi:hypothetical protein FQB35_15630 (plasmid) [Crassaminicella thermophila]|uniref:Uncharacterized protein n=1 Tax=Crassaminicella thermophila TaxID=2599308 RepID=A0A5C0SGR2_CRATE|nr:hypothetical protein [Crassaminicella thermophila]QEK13755.1 hypothetical protein FQB35_15630 [Crassaminicella thermophila]